MSDEHIAGTIRIGWSISERDLGIAGIERDLTRAEIMRLVDRIEDAVTSVIHDRVDVWIDGEESPPITVHVEIMGDLEIDDGPVNGLVDDIRSDA